MLCIQFKPGSGFAIRSYNGIMIVLYERLKLAFMSTQTSIQSRLECLNPVHLEVANESHMHNVPPGSESHFRVTVVSDQFNGKMLVARHRMINQLLAEELAGSIHALALHTKTPDEWFQTGGQSAKSPPCLGGSASK